MKILCYFGIHRWAVGFRSKPVHYSCRRCGLREELPWRRGGAA